MTNLQSLFTLVDTLKPDELRELHHYIEQREAASWMIISPENLERIDHLMRPVQEEAAAMREEEINEIINQAITEVRPLNLL